MLLALLIALYANMGAMPRQKSMRYASTPHACAYAREAEAARGAASAAVHVSDAAMQQQHAAITAAALRRLYAYAAAAS